MKPFGTFLTKDDSITGSLVQDEISVKSDITEDDLADFYGDEDRSVFKKPEKAEAPWHSLTGVLTRDQLKESISYTVTDFINKNPIKDRNYPQKLKGTLEATLVDIQKNNMVYFDKYNVQVTPQMGNNGPDYTVDIMIKPTVVSDIINLNIQIS